MLTCISALHEQPIGEKISCVKRVLIIALVSALAFAVALLVLARARQTAFGEIKRTTLAEPHPPTQLEIILSGARQVLHLAAVDTRKRNYLAIGDAQMEWSLMSTDRKTGWLYFAKPESNDPIWEFGSCSRSTLKEVIPDDLKVAFVRQGDTNGIRASFNADSWMESSVRDSLENARAIPVKEREVILARLIKFPETIYAICLTHQEGSSDWGSIKVEYVTIDTNKDEPGGAAPITDHQAQTPAAGSSQ